MTIATQYRIRMIHRKWRMLAFDASDKRVDAECAGPFDHIDEAQAAADAAELVDADRNALTGDRP